MTRKLLPKPHQPVDMLGENLALDTIIKIIMDAAAEVGWVSKFLMSLPFVVPVKNAVSLFNLVAVVLINWCEPYRRQNHPSHHQHVSVFVEYSHC